MFISKEYPLAAIQYRPWPYPCISIHHVNEVFNHFDTIKAFDCATAICSVPIIPVLPDRLNLYRLLY